MTTTIIILLSVAVVLFVLLIAVLTWRNIRQNNELRQKNNFIVREVRRNQALIRQNSHGVRHLGMGASSPKMRIEKRKSVASVSFV